MAKKIYDLAVKTGEYTTSQGEKKGRWVNVGMIMQGDDGKEFMMLNRTFNPAGVPDLTGKGGESILIGKFPAKDQSQSDSNSIASQSQSASKTQAGDSSLGAMDDDIPF